MFKLVVLSALVAFVAAKPSGIALGYSAIAAPVAVPAAVSHQYRTDVISKPVVATYAAAPVVHQAVVAAPTVYAAPVVQKTVAVAAPVAYSAAVSHQSRVDVHSGLVAHAPVAYAAHAPVAYAAHVPAVHAVHAAPAVHAW